MILNDLVLPIVNGSIPLFFVLSIPLVFNIHSCIILIISNLKFTELLSESWLISFQIVLHSCLSGILFLHHFGLLPLNEIIDCVYFFCPCLLFFQALTSRTTSLRDSHQLVLALNFLHHLSLTKALRVSHNDLRTWVSWYFTNIFLEFWNFKLNVITFPKLVILGIDHFCTAKSLILPTLLHIIWG